MLKEARISAAIEVELYLYLGSRGCGTAELLGDLWGQGFEEWFLLTSCSTEDNSLIPEEEALKWGYY